MLSLRKGSRKETCPSCGRKTFTPYVDDFGVALDASVGRCDRQDKCRYHYPPAEFYRDRRPLGAGRYKTSRPNGAHIRKAPVSKPTFIDSQDFKSSFTAYDRNPLALFLKKVFGKYLGEERINDTLARMGLGTSRKFGGSAIFWQVDIQGRIRDGKVMGYDSATGKRVKHPVPQVTNVHTLLKDRYSGNFRPCFFGSHLAANDRSGKPILLFESEKAAVVMALVFEMEGAWLGWPMATGGCGVLNPKEENLRDCWHGIQVLRNRDVILFPDNGKYDEWLEKASQLEKFSRSVQVATIMETALRRIEPQCLMDEGDGFDDLLLRYLEGGLPYGDLMNHCV